MPKLPPEDELAPTHELGGDPTDEDVPTPDLDDYDTDPEPGLAEPVEVEHVAIPEEEDADERDIFDGEEVI
ncbi:hypothetical protein [Nesterenkonia flava]|uniref:Uncharacterized protein n=1 Tax=Nesterenkonia flava TaxID=469799 RepID=A0ABU1FRU8_9MICC|nr:hypothetical protein [Nesterenkonia flava]MDR5711385.1 hypothetical protein [Nesterenkonia flava]